VQLAGGFILQSRGEGVSLLLACDGHCLDEALRFASELAGERPGSLMVVLATDEQYTLGIRGISLLPGLRAAWAAGTRCCPACSGPRLKDATYLEEPDLSNVSLTLR